MVTPGGAIDTKRIAEVISVILKQAANACSYSTAGRVGTEAWPCVLRDRLTRRLAIRRRRWDILRRRRIHDIAFRTFRWLGLIGPNGSEKSNLLKSLAGPPHKNHAISQVRIPLGLPTNCWPVRPQDTPTLQPHDPLRRQSRSVAPA